MTPIVFVDRDGTLIAEPVDHQIDALDKLHLVANVIPALLTIQAAGYQLVIVSNQDGLGTPAFPEASFQGPHDLMMEIFSSQGIHFREVLIDRSTAQHPLPTRKPGIGLVTHYLQDRQIDWQRCAVVGDRPTDLAFAEQLKIPGYQLKTAEFGGQWTWPTIAHQLANAPRQATVTRHTQETQICIRVDLDAGPSAEIHTGLGFFDHMLAQISRHAGIGLTISSLGDLQVDEHHTIEDTALVLGQALQQAWGNKRGIARYGFTLPMDESLAQAVLDLSQRPFCVFQGHFHREKVGDFPTELVPHFFRSLCQEAGISLHLKVHGDNDHHQIEACFKAFGRALGQAITRQGHRLPSTKGVL